LTRTWGLVNRIAPTYRSKRHCAAGAASLKYALSLPDDFRPPVMPAPGVRGFRISIADPKKGAQAFAGDPFAPRNVDHFQVSRLYELINFRPARPSKLAHLVDCVTEGVRPRAMMILSPCALFRWEFETGGHLGDLTCS
jgi:hypothetical protein